MKSVPILAGTDHFHTRMKMFCVLTELLQTQDAEIKDSKQSSERVTSNTYFRQSYSLIE